MEERAKNATFDGIDLSDEELKGNVTDNELMWMFQLVYGLSFAGILITGIIKSIGVSFR